jgi:hypothetical protein
MAKRLQSKAKSGQVLPPPITANILSLEMQNPDGIRPVYSNNAAVLIAPHDLRILFSEVTVPSPSSKVPTLELRANVTMTPTLFKALAQAVTKTLAAYEEQFGKIQWPPKNQ